MSRALGCLVLVCLALGPTTARADLGAYIKTNCDFERSPWCRLPGDPKTSYISQEEALAISRGDKDARKRLWGWGGPKETFVGWGSAVTDGKRMYFYGGGHHHYRGNDLKVYDFTKLEWSRLYDPAYVTSDKYPAGGRRYVPEVGPRATHMYDGMAYSEKTNSIFIWGHYNFHAWQFDLGVWEETKDPWKAWSSFALPKDSAGRSPNFYRTAVLENGNILVHGSRATIGRGTIFVFDPVNKRYIRRRNAQFQDSDLTAVGNRAYGRTAGKRRLNVYNADGAEIGTLDLPPGFPGHGIEYVPDRNLLVLWEGQADTLVYNLETDAWRQVGTLAEDVPQGAYAGPYGRWQYLPDHGVFVGLGAAPEGGQAMWAYRLPDPLPETHPKKQVRKSQGYTCSDEIAGWHCPDLQDQVDAGSVRKGLYHQCAKVDNRVDFNGAWLTKKVCGRKASLIASDGAVIENVKITDISIGSNANCVRWEGGRVTIRNMTCKNVDMGLLGVGDELVIADSTFADILDGGSQLGHIIYACPFDAQGSTLVVRNTTLATPGDEGHVLKSGCATTRIEGSVLDAKDGNYSRVIDAFNGGQLVIRNSTLRAGKSGGNGDLIGFGAERRDALETHRVDLRGGTVDCRTLPMWGQALHTWPNKVRVASVTWQPATNHDCRVQ